MSSGFDPCKQWLGIDALSLGDPWLVLGIERSETNPLAIVRAADARLAILRGVPAGPLTLARDALLKRVETARDELLAAALAAAPVAPVAPAPPRPMFAPPPVPSAPPVPQLATAAPGVRLSNRPVEKQGHGPQIAIAACSLLAVCLAGYFAYPILVGKTKARPNPDVAVATPSVQGKGGKTENEGSRVKPGPGATDDDEPAPAKKPVQRKPTPADDSADADQNPKPEMRTKTDQEPEPASTTKPKPESPADSEPTEEPKPQVKPKGPEGGSPEDPEMREDPDTKPVSKPKPAGEPDDPEMRNTKKPAGEAEQDPTPSAKPESQPTKSDPEPTTPKPEPEPKPEPAADPAATVAAISKLLKEAHAALREHEFDTANAALESALDKAGDDVELADRVNSFRQLAAYAKQFLDYRDKAFKAAADGGIYELPNGKTLSVVEINDEVLVYKDGLNKRIPIDKVPPFWIQAIITKWFSGDDQPGNHVFLGVYHVLKEKPDLKAAQSEWGLAQFGGENVKLLMPLLRDPILKPAVDDN